MSERKSTGTPSCGDCGARCCRYVATQIDTPTCKRDYDNIRWYLRHERMAVFVDHDNAWYLEVETRCRALGKDGRCLAYATRPRICREHGETDGVCEFHSSEAPHKQRFTSADMFERYLDARGIDWRWKRP
jgi:uncharacterized protein